MIEQTLQEALGIDSKENLVGVNLSIDDYKTPPKEFIGQMAKVIKADKEGLLSSYSDFRMIQHIN